MIRVISSAHDADGAYAAGGVRKWREGVHAWVSVREVHEGDRREIGGSFEGASREIGGRGGARGHARPSSAASSGWWLRPMARAAWAGAAKPGRVEVGRPLLSILMTREVKGLVRALRMSGGFEPWLKLGVELIMAKERRLR